MNANVGSLDRAVRILLGVIILGAGVAFQSWWGLIGLAPLITGIVRYCPGYKPFGISTCGTQKT